MEGKAAVSAPGRGGVGCEARLALVAGRGEERGQVQRARAQPPLDARARVTATSFRSGGDTRECIYGVQFEQRLKPFERGHHTASVGGTVAS